MSYKFLLGPSYICLCIYDKKIDIEHESLSTGSGYLTKFINKHVL